MHIKSWLTAAVAFGLTGCANMGTEQVVTVDSPDPDTAQVLYQPVDGCLLARQAPTQMILRRGQYQLRAQGRVSYGDKPAQVEISLVGKGLTAQFPQVTDHVEVRDTDTGILYRLNVDDVPDSTLKVTVMQGNQPLGEETVLLKPQKCRTLGFGG